MNSEQFNAVFHNQIRLCEDILLEKAREYATEDRLHNFKIAAELQGISPIAALAGMMAKHTVSVYDMVGSGMVFPMDQWDEKITDHINYLILLSALVLDTHGDDRPTSSFSPVNEFLNSLEENNA